MKQMGLSSVGALQREEATCQGGGYPIALVWSCLLWEGLEPRFGDTEVPLPGSFCFRLEGGVRGGPVAFILAFL